jgi:hypothetical protein
MEDGGLFEAVHEFALEALTDGSNPAELSSALTAVAVRVALDLAPNAGEAFAVVMRAVSDAAATWASSHRSQSDDLGSAAALRQMTVH